MRRREMERIIRRGSATSCLLMAVLLLPGLPLPSPLSDSAPDDGPVWEASLLSRFTDHGGEEVLPPFVRASRRVLSQHRAPDFACSELLQQAHRGKGRYQRLLEGVYPISYRDGSSFVLTLPDEALRPGCTRLEAQEEVTLVHCTP